MAQCGFNVGMTFQIVDDLLDVVGDEQRVGKPIGIDLRDGNPSLPVVLALQRDAEVARVFERRAPSEGEIALTRWHVSAPPACSTRCNAMAARVRQPGAREPASRLAPPPTAIICRALVDQLTDRVAA